MNTPYNKKQQLGFTLIELLVVIAIIALLVSILLPSLARAKELARRAVCLTSLSGQLTAIHMYAAEEKGYIPIGPDDNMPFPPMPYRAMASNQIWIDDLRYNAHGVLLEKYLTQPEAFFCPSDDSAEQQTELPKIYKKLSENAYCSYYYRQLDAQKSSPPSAMLEKLGENDEDGWVVALLMDANSLMTWPPTTRTNHNGEWVAVGCVDGHADGFDTPNGEMTLGEGVGFGDFIPRIDEIFETADSLNQ